MNDDQGQPIKWIDGGNLEFGDCVRTACANLKLLVTGQRMTDGEVENAYGTSGWTPLDPSTDRGEQVAAVLEQWKTTGWPADPLDKIVSYEAITAAQIPAAITEDGACIVWCELPMVDGDWSFSDAALEAEPVGAHCVLAVQADDDGLTIVTWGDERRVSWRWWERFGKGQFSVRLPGA